MSQTSIDIIIEPDGSLMVERGTKEQNKILPELLGGMIEDPDALHRFISMTDHVEIVDGDTTLCG